MRAAIMHAANEPVKVEEIRLEPPRAGEVKVKVAAAGVCHSDLSVWNGTIPQPTPIVLGHEGSGIVAEVGPGVSSVKPGDHVILNWVAHCARCTQCMAGRPHLCDVSGRTGATGTMPDGSSRLTKNGSQVFHFSATSCMAEEAILPETGCVRIDPSFPLDRAALVGCAVLTGVGAVINTAQVPAGASVVIYGLGGVGLSVLMGAVLAGAHPIIAVDVVDAKIEAAQRFGATHTINAKHEERPDRKVREYTDGRGADFAFEAIGNPAVIGQAYNTLGKRGTLVIVGITKPTDQITISPFSMVFTERIVKGCFFGSCRPHLDGPKLLTLYRAGKLPLDDLVTRYYRLDEINQAFDDLDKGRNLRGVISFQ